MEDKIPKKKNSIQFVQKIHQTGLWEFSLGFIVNTQKCPITTVHGYVTKKRIGLFYTILSGIDYLKITPQKILSQDDLDCPSWMLSEDPVGIQIRQILLPLYPRTT